MYKVLLVDDERIILEGISNLVDWESMGTRLVDTARSGYEAFEKISKQTPDIVITDIKMPGMDGLELVGKTVKEYPNIKFIILSGYGEFDYAKRAIEYGVKRYLLKPSNEIAIMEAVSSIVSELDEENQQKIKLETSQQYIHDQVLKDILLNKSYSITDLKYLENRFDIYINNKTLRLIIFKIEGDFANFHLFALNNIGKELLETLILSTIIEDHVIFLLEDDSKQKLIKKINAMKDTFNKIYKMALTVVISKKGYLNNLRNIYHDSMNAFKYRFYNGKGSVISCEDLYHDIRNQKQLNFDVSQFVQILKYEDKETILQSLNQLFTELKRKKWNIKKTRNFIFKLSFRVIKEFEPENIDNYFDQINDVVDKETLVNLQYNFQEFILNFVNRYNYNKLSKQEVIVNKMIEAVNKYYSDPELSLKLIAHKILFMNADYLGKTFKKERNENFSDYLVNVRIEKAIEILEQERDIKISTLAQKVGYGNNPQYFSQVFKKVTGYTPSEYLKQFTINTY